MSAFSDIQDKQQRGEPLTSLEFAVWWCSDVVAARKAATELAAKDDCVKELLEALEKATQELHKSIYTRAANTWATPEIAYEHANKLTESYRAAIAKAKGE
jgi:hypothetical protein